MIVQLHRLIVYSTSYLLRLVTPGTRDLVIVSDCNCACRGGDSRVTRDSAGKSQIIVNIIYFISCNFLCTLWLYKHTIIYNIL